MNQQLMLPTCSPNQVAFDVNSPYQSRGGLIDTNKVFHFNDGLDCQEGAVNVKPFVNYCLPSGSATHKSDADSTFGHKMDSGVSFGQPEEGDTDNKQHFTQKCKKNS